MLGTLRKINEWWETKEVPGELAPKSRRRVFHEIAGMLEDRRIIGIIGPRRTGKTTLMFQLMDMLIRERGVNPKNILFFSCDDVDLREKEDLIGEAVRVYYEEFLKQDYRGEKCYIFIDEAHWIKDWQLRLKKYYDLKYNIKFIISGSSAAKMRREQKESLAGRIMEFSLFPMGFSEFLKFRGKEVSEGISLENMTHERLKAEREKLGPKRVLEIKRILDEYLLVGGLPEWFETRNVRKWQKKLMEDIVKRVLYDDIATLYGIKNPVKLESLLRLLSALQSRIYSYNSIANTLGIDNETAERYISYLKESFIVFELLNYAASKEKQLRRNYKYVLFDSGIRNALERIRSPLEGDTGYILESAVQQHFLWKSEEEAEVFYWREKEEVDIVIKAGRDVTPVEIKYQSDISARDLAGLVRFMEQHKITKGLVVTKDAFKLRKHDRQELLFVPAWLFLYVF